MDTDLFARIGDIFGAAYSKNSPVLEAQVVGCCDFDGTPNGALWVPPVEDAVIVEEEEFDWVDSPSFGEQN